jgi:hypothetical protein
MRIGIEINGVLRDTLKKIQQEYEKWYLNENWKEMKFVEDEKDIERKVISEVSSLNLNNHLVFRNEDEVYDFLYKEHTMEIFGHASSVEYSGMNDLNDFYAEMRENHDIIIVSDEIGKSKPSSLFFISKFGCLIETIKFYSEPTINSMWDSIDVLLTANPNLLLTHPEGKTVIKYETTYNKDIETKYSITKLKELNTKIKQLYD